MLLQHILLKRAMDGVVEKRQDGESRQADEVRQALPFSSGRSALAHVDRPPSSQYTLPKPALIA